MVGVRNFQDTFETRKRSFVSPFSIYMTVLCCSVEKVFLKISQNLQENTCVEKETPTQVFSCEFCQILKTSFFIGFLYLKYFRTCIILIDH